MENRFTLKREVNGSREIDIPAASLAAMLLATNYPKRESELQDHVSDLNIKNYCDHVSGFTPKDVRHLVLGYLVRNGLAEVEDGLSNSITLSPLGINVIYDIIETEQVPDEWVKFTPKAMAGSKTVTIDESRRLDLLNSKEDYTMMNATATASKGTTRKAAPHKTVKNQPAANAPANTDVAVVPQDLQKILTVFPDLALHVTKTEQFGQIVTPRCRVTVYATKKGMTIYAYRVRGEAGIPELEQINNLLFQGKGSVKKVYTVYRTTDMTELEKILHLA